MEVLAWGLFRPVGVALGFRVSCLGFRFRRVWQLCTGFCEVLRAVVGCSLGFEFWEGIVEFRLHHSWRLQMQSSSGIAKKNTEYCTLAAAKALHVLELQPRDALCACNP